MDAKGSEQQIFHSSHLSGYVRNGFLDPESQDGPFSVMNEIAMTCGRSGRRVVLDPAWQVELVRKPAMPALADPVTALEAALDAPVGAPPLAQLAAAARRVAAINFGALLPSHAAAVACMRKYAERKMDRTYGVVLTSSAGYPLDLTYYQTVKGMVSALGALKPGGKLFIVSECAEGMGSAEFREAQRRFVREGAEKFMAHLLSLPRAPVDAWQTEMLLKALRHGTVHLCSGGLPETDWPDTGVRRVKSLEQELAAAVAASGENALAVIPEGPYVIPV
jgi:predicted kinase